MLRDGWNGHSSQHQRPSTPLPPDTGVVSGITQRDITTGVVPNEVDD